MYIANLKNIDRLDLMSCFNLAFADYFVKMPTAIDYWENRWAAAGLDDSLSFGMFEEGKMVAFILNGIGFQNKKLTAFNTGTGVIPAYRGRKIVNLLYNYAIPQLKKNGVERCALEVITANEKAIKAYQSVGFQIIKTLKCYQGTFDNYPDKMINVVRSGLDKIDWENLPNQNYYSWDNQQSAILNSKKDYEYYEVLENKNKVGFFIVNPKTGNLAQFDLFQNHTEKNWQQLFTGIMSIVPVSKINNIDEQLTQKIDAVEKSGLSHVIDQYEMEYFINTKN